MRKAIITALMMCLLSGLAAAQIPTSGNVFLGYSYENAGSSALNLDLNRNNLNGWEASLEGKVFPALGIVADFSGHYGSQSFTPSSGAIGDVIPVNVTGHEFEVMFGPRFSVPAGKFRPFAEFEFGVGHMNTNDFGSSNAFAMALGGGVDYRIVRIAAWRVEGDYVTTRYFGTSQQNIRLSTGIVVRF